MHHNLPYPSYITNKTTSLATKSSPLNQVIDALHMAKRKIGETKPPASDELNGGSTMISTNVSKTYSKDGVVANVFVPPDIEKIIADQQSPVPPPPRLIEFTTTSVKKKLIDADKKKLGKNQKRKYQHTATSSKEQLLASKVAKRNY